MIFALAAVLIAGCSGDGSGPRSDRPADSRLQATATPSTLLTTTTVIPPTTFPSPPGVVFNGTRDRREVALTFDSNLTDAMIRELDHSRVASFANVAVLDELDQLQVPATIFLAGKWIERYPDLTARIAADPLLEVGSHSYAHRAFHLPCYGLGGLGPTEMAADVAHSEALLRQFTSHPTPYFRFPGGCYDDAALAAIAPTGVSVMQYDLPSGDAFGTSVGTIVRTVLNKAQNGSIVVMHITGGNTAPLTDKALPFIVQGLRARGVALVTLSQLLRPG